MSKIKEHIIWNSEEENADIWYEAERVNLNKELGKRILVIADLGLWNGRRSGYRILNSTNLNAVLEVGEGDYRNVYVKGNDICATDIHHDGTNYYTFRLIKDEDKIDLLTNKIYDGTYTRRDVNRYTEPLGKYAAEIFGW